MNSSDALLVYTLLKDYHAITPDLKALRSHPASWYRDGDLQPELVEAARSRATGWFNQVAIMYLRGLIDVTTLRLVAQQRAAQLWVEHVADLDKEVRRKAGGDRAADEMPMVERFWRDYAEGRVPTMQFVFGPHAVTH